MASGDGRLRFDVTDDGVGFDTAASAYGTGLQLPSTAPARFDAGLASPTRAFAGENADAPAFAGQPLPNRFDHLGRHVPRQDEITLHGV
jgi:hypothetical protein